ncbi:MAG: cytochrome c biogenesis protein CcsA [Candidatus Schekmanbacteria bacterium]|nr:cytochrome c biogenesis protein CcsA [Candidatus Schekmanbacteria bacterium]
MGMAKWEDAVGAIGLILLGVGHYMGLFIAPKEAMMGDVGRILYVHVPVAWISMLSFLVAFVAALGYFFRGTTTWDALMESAVEVGVVLTSLLLALGSLWARPTWGVWWDWDPRLTTAAVMLLAFLGVTALRRLVDGPEQRATWSAVATVVAFVNVPIVYFSVKWWRSLHQTQSSPKTVDPGMVTSLRVCAFAVLFIAIFFIARRWRIAKTRLENELAPPEALLDSEEA